MRRLLARTAWTSGLVASIAIGAAGSASAEPIVAREPYAKAFIQLMLRSETKGQARLFDLDVYAEGTRLRAALRGKGVSGEFWIDGLGSEPLFIKGGKVVEPRRHSLEHALVVALRPSPDLGNSKNDRVAGKPCKVVTESLKGGATMTRCIWRGLPLSVELSGGGLSLNAAAVLVSEGEVTVADVQPPLGAPSAAAGLSAGR